MMENKEELARIITAENVSGAAGVGTGTAPCRHSSWKTQHRQENCDTK